jgi:TP901 family phage tail tape measure protein
MPTKGQAKVELLLDLKSKLKTGFTKAKETVNSNVREIKSKINDIKSSSGSSFKNMFNGFSLNPVSKQFGNLKLNAVKAMRDIQSEVPMVGTAFRLLKNPITLAAAAIFGIGKAANSAINDAAGFNTQFRELQMLNLDKPIADMQHLKRLVKDTAFKKGFDMNQTSTAFFDVQSVTGKYRSEVKNIVAKQGEFAKLMQADFNSWVEGTAKAMANYGFGADKLDEFNRAAFATVKTGVTTFDQLSKVMSVYAGSASSAKQNFGAANKIFSLFTVKVKSVDEAATLTKSLFNDLTKKSTIDAFKKIGINMYNNNGEMKQADSLLLELSNKFKKLGDNDRALIDLKNQFTGSEGLTSFIQSAMGSTEQLQSMINNFDATGLDLSKALNISRQDSAYLNEQLENRLKILKADIGEEMLPTKVAWQETKLRFLGNARSYINPANAAKGYEQKGTDDILEKFSDIINNPGQFTTTQFDDVFADIHRLYEFYQNDYAKVRKYEANIYEYTKPYQRFSAHYDKGALSTLSDLDKKLQQAYASLPEDHDQSLADQEAGVKTGNEDTSLVKESPIDKITGNAKQIRNLTINIDSFVKGGINTENTTLQNMDAQELKEWFSKMMMRVVRNTELGY